jgi:hypothetical protein
MTASRSHARRPAPIPGTRPERRGERGQSSVELLALLPLTLIIGLAVLSLLAARAANGQATAAAQAGAMALIQDADPAAAARAALPPAARRRATIRVRGRVVAVTVRPATRLTFMTRMLARTSTAHAGPAAAAPQPGMP